MPGFAPLHRYLRRGGDILRQVGKCCPAVVSDVRGLFKTGGTAGKRYRWQIWQKTKSSVTHSKDGSRSAPDSVFADFDATHIAANVSIDPGKTSDAFCPACSETTIPETIQPLPDRLPAAYELVKTLNGALGHFNTPIHLVRQRRSGKLFIIKQVAVTGTPEWPPEASLLEDLIHSNIIGLESVHYDGNGSFCIANIVLQYCSGGDVADFASFLWDNDREIPVQFIQHLVSSMIDALLFIHHGESYCAATDTIHRSSQHSVLHRDIKENNIFLDRTNLASNGLPQILLADFGLSTQASKNVSVCGTTGYMAPEVLNACNVAAEFPDRFDDIMNTTIMSAASDWFAFGVVLYRLITGKEYTYRLTEVYIDFAASACIVERDLLQLLVDCLAVNPADRPDKADSLRLHRLSAKLKAGLQRWHDEGGRLSEDIWPEPFRFERVKPEESATGACLVFRHKDVSYSLGQAGVDTRPEGVMPFSAVQDTGLLPVPRRPSTPSYMWKGKRAMGIALHTRFMPDEA